MADPFRFRTMYLRTMNTETCTSSEHRPYFVQASSEVHEEWLRCHTRCRTLCVSVSVDSDLRSWCMYSLQKRGFPLATFLLPLAPSRQEAPPKALFPFKRLEIRQRSLEKQVLRACHAQNFNPILPGHSGTNTQILEGWLVNPVVEVPRYWPPPWIKVGTYAAQFS